MAALASRAAALQTPKNHDGRDKCFITEIDSAASKSTANRWGAITSTATSNSKEDEGDIRPGEPANQFTPTTAEAATNGSGDGGAQVFRVIDSMSEKQQRSRNIRSVIQKAAQKTILVVRTKNAIQAAENVTVRFNKDQVTDTPRSVQLRFICEKVLRHARYSSKKKKQQYQEIFTNAAEVDALLKDMFWYVIAHCFQSNQHPEMEKNLHARIADNFTALFIRLQMQPTSRDSGFFDMLPDMIAQILFMALYEAFPKSRKTLMSNETRCKLLRICHCWILGFVPADLSSAHWIAVDQESPKSIAALAAFPAMRNRMLRAERIERTKLEVKTRHGSSLVNDAAKNETDDELDPETHDIADEKKLPRVTADDEVARGGDAHIQTRERCVYQMRNSPLVDAFLKRHQLEANTLHLKVQLRMTSGKHFDLKTQEALHETSLPRGRRRRIVDPKAYTDVLSQIESFGDNVRQAYASEKKKMQDRDAAERRRVLEAQRALELQLGALKQRGDRMREFSNLLVSKGRIDALMPSKDRSLASPKDPTGVRSASTTVFTPRPPPRPQAASASAPSM